MILSKLFSPKKEYPRGGGHDPLFVRYWGRGLYLIFGGGVAARGLSPPWGPEGMREPSLIGYLSPLSWLPKQKKNNTN